MNLRIEPLTNKHLDQIMLLQDQVFEDLKENASILRRNTREMFDLCLRNPNLTLGMYDKDALIGIAILVDVKGSEEDLSLHLQKEYCLPVRPVNFKLAMVKKEYYGIGFQKTMLILLEKVARERGYNLMCATVSPKNIHSKKNLLEFGFVVDHTEEKYGGLLRDVCVKPLEGGIEI
ncbi:MAG: hypothetical protein KBT48_11235 [Firmicutes bacterium]|nr:hypothetical protein [Bacillota bacterium]